MGHLKITHPYTPLGEGNIGIYFFDFVSFYYSI